MFCVHFKVDGGQQNKKKTSDCCLPNISFCPTVAASDFDTILQLSGIKNKYSYRAKEWGGACGIVGFPRLYALCIMHFAFRHPSLLPLKFQLHASMHFALK